MSVTRITEFRSRETVAVLEHLLERAKRGELIGIAMCALPTHGPEEITFTDLYRRNPAAASNACMRVSWRLTQMQDELDMQQEAL